MSTRVLVQVPVEDARDLEQLAERVGQPAALSDSRAYDGDSLVHLVLVVSATSVPVLKAWIRARVEQRKATKVSYDGMELAGYTPDEVERIIGLLDEISADGTEEHPDDGDS